MASGTLARRSIEPIQLGLYTLHEEGLDVDGVPTFREHESVGEFIRRAHKASGWWLADWLNYGESRSDFKQKLEAVLDAGIVKEKTAQNLKYIGKAIPRARRRENVDFSLHAEVAGLEPDEQDEWLEKAETEGYTRQELRKQIRASKRARIIEGQAALEGMFRVIYADPPWKYGDSAATADGSLAKAERHYEGLTIAELCRLPVASHALPDSVLFMWVTAPMLYDNPGPREVIEAWGFKHKSGLVWDKVLHNFGHYVGVHHEHLLICTRGSCLPDQPLPLEDSVVTIRRGPVHSEKPEYFRELITKHWTRGPFLELFARKRVEGWSAFGNDARLWADEMGASA
jgi:N6-adenosine-specific RNA methylase IME4